jgi:putative transposase
MRGRGRINFEAHGNLFFITSTVVGFANIFNNQRCRDIFVNCVHFYQARGDFILLAWVLMPNHFHMILKCSERVNISNVVGNIKRYISRQIGQLYKSPDIRPLLPRIKHAGLKQPGKRTGVWQPRFDSFVIMSEHALKQKTDYIHNNPVRKGFVDEPWQWKHSSASAYVGRPGIDLLVDNGWRCLGYGSGLSGKDS